MTQTTMELDQNPKSFYLAVDLEQVDDKSGEFRSLDEDESVCNSIDDRNGNNHGQPDFVLTQPIEFITSPDFKQPDADELILGSYADAACETHGNGKSSDLPKAPPGTPPYLASLYETPLLSPDQEYSLFRKMNYLKFCAERLRERIDLGNPQRNLIDRIGRLLSDALDVRNHIVRSNLRLVVSIAKTVVDQITSFEDAVSHGNVPLIRAVEIFDFERGTKFSTYATWAIRNSLYRATSRNRRERQRFVSCSEGFFESVHERRSSQRARETYIYGLRAAIDSMLVGLDRRDRKIVFDRFGLGGNDNPQRFREIAEGLNISTERVRQLLLRSIRRMGESVEAEAIELG